METCDKCGTGVAASVVVMTPDGPLTFCGHCNTQYNKVWKDLEYPMALIASPGDVAPVFV